jgi:hypothetical protein
MNKMSKVLLAMVSVTAALASGAAFAIPRIDVPEPGMTGIVAGGMIAVVVAARLRLRK